MNKLVIDAASEKIFLMIITKNDIYNITKENTKINYEKLTSTVMDFLNSISLKLVDINKIYVNRGPGSFAGIRNSLSLVKAFNIGTNAGKISGQSIMHCHIHIIPRREGDVESPQGGVRSVIPKNQHYKRKI